MVREYEGSPSGSHLLPAVLSATMMALEGFLFRM